MSATGLHNINKMSLYHIKTNNKLIAEFMDIKLYKGTFYDMGYDAEDKSLYRSHELKYHDSWDWLMPVIKKINEQIDPNVKGLWRMITHPYDYHVGDVFSQVVEFIINIKN